MRSKPFVFSGASGLFGALTGTSGSSITSSTSSAGASVSAGTLVFSSGHTSVTGASGRDSRESCKEWQKLRFGRETNVRLCSELEAYHVGNFIKMNNG